MKYKKLLFLKAREFAPIFIGLWLGLAFSLMSAPFFDDTCSTSPDGDVAQLGLEDTLLQAQSGGPFRKTNSVGVSSDPISNFDYGRRPEYQPKLQKRDVNNSSTTKPKRLRPRFASTELNIREKLFVGVLTTAETVTTLGFAVNRTLAHQVPKLVFFMTQAEPRPLPSMVLAPLPVTDVALAPYEMFDYVWKHYLKTYDWFYFMPDYTYVRGHKLHEMLKHTSISQDVYVGHRMEGDEKYCSFDGGVLLSHNVMKDVITDLAWCRKNANSDNLSENIGLCVQHASSKACTNVLGSHLYGHYSRPGFDFDQDMVNSGQQPHLMVLSHAVSVSNIRQERDIYKLHRYFSELEMNETKKKLEETKSYIVELAPRVKTEKLTFPIGVDPPVKLQTRFDMIRWDYFTTTHIYIDSDSTNMKELSGIHKKDIDEILTVAMARINKKYTSRYTMKQLINGYRRFDPVRGMSYILDLLLKSPNGEQTRRRVHLIRPLGAVEIVPMPYVTESSKVNLVLAVTLSERDLVVSFLDSYAQTCLDAGDNTHLLVVFVYNVTTYHSDRDVFSVLKSMVAFYETKYENVGAHIAWTSVYARRPNQYTVMDAIARKFGPESLFLLCTVGMELSTEFLNRVRMNTIAGWQVFFPMAFWQYAPNLIYEDKPYPTTIDINKMSGHFGDTRYEHASFYNSDYQHARALLASPASKLDSSDDLFDMFLRYNKLHVFRAVEPALKIRYRERTCSPTLNRDAYQRCTEGRSAGLASKTQLAMLILEHQQKEDPAAAESRQQNEPDSEQKKPMAFKK